MALQYDYKDEYLNKRVTEERERRAASDIANYGLTNQEHIDKLTILKTYTITAIECSSNTDDVFAMKYKLYAKEFEAELNKALADKAASSSSGSLFSAPLYRS